ncbi:alpha-isopropylmalate synthase regulatory domain-containing protein [Chitinimonas koreensis]|nr:alpha-isopropylmalate synthase regulatory domain-containing protein [Chitinimonas koreensis]
MPRRLQVEFSGVVQRHTDASGGEMSADALWRLFSREYLEAQAPLRLHGHHLDEDGEAQRIELVVERGGHSQRLEGAGNGPIAAATDALGLPLKVLSYEERSLGHGADARAVAFVEIAFDGVDGAVYGVGLSANIVTASLQALIGAANRAQARIASAQACTTAAA